MDLHLKPDTLGSLAPQERPATEFIFGRGLVTDSDSLPSLINLDTSARQVLISDETVFALHGQALLTRLRQAGFMLNHYVVPATEHSKSTGRLITLIDRILLDGIDKESCVITLGGGMVNNLGGLVASLLHRGIALVHLPSSLLAQLDAAIDNKQAVNHGSGKNLVGSIYPPRAVLIDPELLLTLSPRQLRNGVAEAIKHALTQSVDYLLFLQQNARRLGEPIFHEQLVRRTVDLKLSLIGSDSDSRGEALLQYGHCIGHALECVTDFRLLHGEAISIGMTLSAEISHNLGLCGPHVVEAHYRIFSDYGLPTSLPEGFPVGAFIRSAQRDKYCHNGQLRMTLLKDIGDPFCQGDSFFVDVDPADIESVFKSKAALNSKLTL